MAKKKYIDYKKQQEELFKRTEGYAADVRKIYQRSFTEIINLVKGTELEEGKPFSFSGYGYSEEVTPILRNMYSQIYQVICGGVGKEWLSSNENNDNLVKAVFGEHSIEDNHFARYFQRNKEAMDAFFARKSPQGGLNLSQKVWNYTRQYKEELEYALDLSLGEGEPANRIATKVKKYLQDPDRFYRRFRVKIGEDEDGNPVYGRKWKRRIWDDAEQSYKWIDAKPKQYHPGRGVYRSSARNAQRLARTETNIAYRAADYERWNQLDFVVGIEIKLSNNHNCKGVPAGMFYDICDELAGIYPKTIKWTGWHPNCRCYAVPVLAPEDTLDGMLDNILDGKDPGSVKSPNEVKEMPSQFHEWKDRNEERIERARDKGTLPYFIRDNEKIIFPPAKPTPKEIAKSRHDARTEEEAQAIRNKWYERKAVYHYGENILRVMDGISDIDTDPLVKALKTGDQALIMDEAGKLKALGKQIYSFDLLDDPMAVARQFSMADAEAVQNAVKTKMDKWISQLGASDWDSLDLEFKIKKLLFETDWLKQNHVGKSWEKTWEVSLNSYQKLLNQALDQKAWNGIASEFAQFQAYKTKSAPFNAMVSKMDTVLLDKSDLGEAKKLIAELQAKQDQLEKARGGAKAVKFKDSDFTKERKDKALWGNKQKYDPDVGAIVYDRTDGDNYFRPFAEKNWASWNANQREVAYLYTSGSSYINEPLYTTYYSTKYGLNGSIRDSWKDIDTLTDMIDKAPRFTRDVWLNRGDSAGGFMGQFGLNLDNFRNNPGALVGKEGVQAPFMSTAHTKGWGFVDHGSEPTRSVVYNIYCPKGTKGIYTEPYSAFGSGDYHWDGKTMTKVENEVEVILQRGTKLRITDAKYDPSKNQWIIDMEVTEQPAKKAGVI